jgi:hypothetical protein
MSSPSFSYGESVLSHLEKVQRLSVEVRADIARRVDSYIKLAKAAKDEALLARLASSAREEQAKAVGQGVNTLDPRWAAPAIAEAWCYATISLSKGYRVWAYEGAGANSAPVVEAGQRGMSLLPE